MNRRWRVPVIAGGAGLAIVAAIVIYSFQAKREIDNQMYVPKPARITPEIVLLQKYVRNGGLIFASRRS